MKIAILYSLMLISAGAHSQSNTEPVNIFIITTDGFRWQEVFTGADSTLINNPRFVEECSLLKQQYWDSTPELRRKKLMPFLWNTIASQGQIYGNRQYENKMNVANIYKISYPGYNEMLTGYPDPFFIPNVPIRNRNTNILEFLNSKDEYSGKVAAFSSWNIFSAILNKKRNHLPGNCGYERLPDDSTLSNEIINEAQDNESTKKHTRYDLLTYLSARHYIESKQPRIVLLGFGETDEFAHQGRYDLYLEQATNVDKMISELWYYVQTTPFYRNKTYFIITTDHGRGKDPTAWYKHGILTKGSGETWFALIGPDITGKGEMKGSIQFYQKQIASTIAMLLNEPFQTQANKATPIPVALAGNQNLAVANGLK